jgi:hypothetical protein
LLSLSLISDDDALPRGGPEREALNAYQFLILVNTRPAFSGGTRLV